MRCGDGQVLRRGRLGAAQPASSARVRRTRADRPLCPQPSSASSAVLRAREPDFGGFCVPAPCACAPAAAVARRERRLCLLQQLERRLAGVPAGLARARSAFGCGSRPSSFSVFIAHRCVSRALVDVLDLAAAPVVLVVLARHVVLGAVLSDLDARASLFDVRVDLAHVCLFWLRLHDAHYVMVAITACDRGVSVLCAGLPGGRDRVSVRVSVALAAYRCSLGMCTCTFRACAHGAYSDVCAVQATLIDMQLHDIALVPRTAPPSPPLTPRRHPGAVRAAPLLEPRAAPRARAACAGARPQSQLLQLQRHPWRARPPLPRPRRRARQLQRSPCGLTRAPGAARRGARAWPRAPPRQHGGQHRTRAARVS